MKNTAFRSNGSASWIPTFGARVAHTWGLDTNFLILRESLLFSDRRYNTHTPSQIVEKSSQTHAHRQTIPQIGAWGQLPADITQMSLSQSENQFHAEVNINLWQ